MATINCDLLRCQRDTPHYFPWPEGKRPLPICPFDKTQTEVDTASTWSVADVYEDAQRLFAEQGRFADPMSMDPATDRWV